MVASETGKTRPLVTRGSMPGKRGKEGILCPGSWYRSTGGARPASSKGCMRSPQELGGEPGVEDNGRGQRDKGGRDRLGPGTR